MARTIKEIKKLMTDQFLSDPQLRNAYGISDPTAKWEKTFSTVSIENILIYIVAVCAHSIELLFDVFKNEIEEQIAQNIVPTTRWYYSQALLFQLGDSLQYNEEKHQFSYNVIDDSKRIVRYVAVKDRGGSIQLMVAKDAGGIPGVLDQTELNAFTAYMNEIKIAGVILDIQSLEADSLQISAEIQVDPQVIDATGKSISTGTYPVVDAINAYLANIKYGGTFNKTKCVDAIQNVSGVIDITLHFVQTKSMKDVDFNVLENNNYTAVSGCFKVVNLNKTLSYVV